MYDHTCLSAVLDSLRATNVETVIVYFINLIPTLVGDAVILSAGIESLESPHVADHYIIVKYQVLCFANCTIGMDPIIPRSLKQLEYREVTCIPSQSMHFY